MPQMKVALHPGTGTAIVGHILEELGCKVIDPATVRAAQDADFDRLILLGGTDVTPSFYGERVRHSYGIDSRRDAIEWTLARKAISNDIPMMGICRGHQMIAVAHGGSLYQDMVKDGATKAHGYSKHPIQDIHPKLSPYLPELTVNSLHHQSVRKVPHGFKVSAVAPDGIVESIWRPGALGVQFHPELLFTDDSRWFGLFWWLIEKGLR